MSLPDGYEESLDKGLLAWMEGNKQPLLDHCKTFKLTTLISSREIVAEVSVRKVITARSGLPMHIRSAAKKWLLEREFASLDDGDVPV